MWGDLSLTGIGSFPWREGVLFIAPFLAGPDEVVGTLHKVQSVPDTLDD